MRAVKDVKEVKDVEDVPVAISQDRFLELAGKFDLVPIWCELLADTITPVGAFAALVGDESEGFLLESVEHAERWGRYSFVGRRSLSTMVANGSEVKGRGETLFDSTVGVGALGTLESFVARARVPGSEEVPELAGALPLYSGVVGFLGYDIVREVESLRDIPSDDRELPDAVLCVTGQLLGFDHYRQRVTVVDNVAVDSAWTETEMVEAYRASCERLAGIRDALAVASPLEMISPTDPGGPLPEFKRVTSRDDYMRSVEVAKESILDGEAFQIVLSQRFDVDLRVPAFEVYRVLRQVNPSPYMYFMRFDEVTLVGSSPEPMVKVADSRVISRPIAGTRRRGKTPEDDRRLEGELKENPKEIAEHVMLVDLARNDVGRVVRYGTERVDEFMTLERYSHVMHMTSQVSGDLEGEVGPVAVLRATFPAGTVSGSPKVAAMKIIDQLEPVKRGPYAGVVGYLDFSGNLDTAIAIRTLVVTPDGRASVQAGAGIVADSDPDAEDRECQYKAAALLAAVGAANRNAT